VGRVLHHAARGAPRAKCYDGRVSADPFRPARWVDAVARAREGVSDRSPVRLDAEDLRRRASRRLGRPVELNDPGLHVLLADPATADLTDLGRLAVRAQLLRRIVTTEALVDTLERKPDLEDVELPRPLVIVGLPRSGTTLLHILLACDPAAFAPRFWQLQQPAPPPSGGLGRGVRYARAGLIVSASRVMLPTLRAIHPLGPGQPEECIFLFRDLGNQAVPFPAFGYLRWLRGDGAGAVDYGDYRRHLQLLATSQSGRRLVLKSPFHLGHLDDLLATLPDALVVHTHREPATALASWCSLAATIGRGTVPSVDLGTLGQRWLDFWADAAERAVVVRGVADPRRFHDVRYDDLVSEPLDEVRRLYAAAGLPLTPTTRRRMEQWLDRHHRRRRPHHRYDLAQFDLDRATVDARFRAYGALVG
jgi:Sulfotransferase family